MLSIDDLTLTGDDKIKADLHGKNWRIYEEEKQKEQVEESSRELSESFNRQSQQLHCYSEMRISEQVEAMRRIEAEKNKPVNNQTIQETEPDKPRKKLKSLQRETSEGLVLIHQLLAHYDVKYLDQLTALNAWNKIQKEFTSDLIQNHNKKEIIFNDGTKLIKKDFLEKYRQRFE